jgi:hypothetical protein
MTEYRPISVPSSSRPATRVGEDDRRAGFPWHILGLAVAAIVLLVRVGWQPARSADQPRGVIALGTLYGARTCLEWDKNACWIFQDRDTTRLEPRPLVDLRTPDEADGRISSARAIARAFSNRAEVRPSRTHAPGGADAAGWAVVVLTLLAFIAAGIFRAAWWVPMQHRELSAARRPVPVKG